MTTKWLKDDLKGDEGLALTAYPDPISKGEPWTIGYGHTYRVKKGDKCTIPEADAFLDKDIAHAIEMLDEKFAWWRKMDDLRQDVLANMMFNMGTSRLSGFVNTLAAMKRGDYAEAADRMLESLWAKQVKGRARRLAQQMRTGRRKYND
jgi:lysozyme